MVFRRVPVLANEAFGQECFLQAAKNQCITTKPTARTIDSCAMIGFDPCQREIIDCTFVFFAELFDGLCMGEYELAE